MKQKNYWILWLCLYVICMLAGFIPNPAGFSKVLLLLLSICFFIPGAILVYNAQCSRDRKTLFCLRIISLSSLVITVAFIIANFLSVLSNEVVGTVLHIFLGIVSVPMFAAQYWLVSLFLWSCLFISTFPKLYRQ